ncbi:hypothetical protein [Paludisphaera mucosa]|uniref:Cytochrome c domain-containing protein n=1 Tax=Paludisphaera mucosa TaxID=3030827 RepID=A0ABT6FIF2_9BACT|nr:hypothetical protein [Paludisphaera mucosa]MDG3007322.1 hypothetical protein [Paludisphaera mucosa]
MIQSNRTLVVVALSALGLAGWKGQDPAESDEPAASPPAAGAPAQADAKPAKAPEKFVLIVDGRLIKGVVTEDPEEDKVVVTQPVGAMRFPSKKVERVFDSIQEVHAFKREQVPDDDIDEQVKLAKWCLASGLQAEAKEHLELILKLDPKHMQARAMTTSILMEEARVSRRQPVDDQVQQTGADVVDPAPAALDMAIVRGARQGMGVSDLPVVFDLPPNAAIKRAQEFKNYVHPVLQTYCAKCHDERYDGAFQLVHVRKKADQTPEALRANLDAALRLVDRGNPGRSELLGSSLRPHGKGPNTRPIFQGSNDKAYQILAAWVGNLRARPVANPLAGEAPKAAPDGEETFAVDRGRISRSSVDVDPIVGAGGASAPPVTVRRIDVPPMRFNPGQGWVDDKNANPDDAPVPFAVSGVMPKLPGQAGAEPKSSPKIPRPKTVAPAPAPAPAEDDAPPLPVADEDDEVPAPKPKKPAKPLKLDPALLQKALQQKNGNP